MFENPSVKPSMEKEGKAKKVAGALAGVAMLAASGEAALAQDNNPHDSLLRESLEGTDMVKANEQSGKVELVRPAGSEKVYVNAEELKKSMEKRNSNVKINPESEIRGSVQADQSSNIEIGQ